MNPKVLVTLGIALLTITGIIFVGSQSAERTSEESPLPLVSPAVTGTPMTDPGSSGTNGQYLDYASGGLTQGSGQRVLFFHAPWCPQCRSIEKGITQDGVPGGFSVIKVDYDSNQDLRQRYGVTQQTTFVKIDEQGNKAGDLYVAYEQPTFDAVIRNYLN